MLAKKILRERMNKASLDQLRDSPFSERLCLKLMCVRHERSRKHKTNTAARSVAERGGGGVAKKLRSPCLFVCYYGLG